MQRHMNHEEFIVSKTDLKGNITYCNKTFMQMSGYSEEELLSAPHNLLRDPDMPKIVFKLLWDRIKNKEGIYAYVKNLTKSGDFYWVFAYITPSLDAQGKIIGYYSVRRKPNPKAVETISVIYSQLLSAEKQGGMNASVALLNKMLEKEGVSYDQLVFSLDK